MHQTKKMLSPALFGIIILCFILPFVSISCGGTQVAQLNGFDFVKGISEQGQNMDPNPLAIIALIAAVIGLGVSFAHKKSANITASAVGVIGFISSIILKSTFDSAAADKGIQTQWMGGYYLTLLLFAAAAAANIYFAVKGGQKETTPGWTNYPLPDGTSPGNAFCTQCGSKLYPGQEFCTGCGTRVSNALERPSSFPPNSFNDAIGVKVDDSPFDNQFSVNKEMAAAPVDTDMTRMLKPELTPVLKIDRSGQEEVIRLIKDQFLIGRSTEGVDYSEKMSNAVSRKHARITKENGSCYLTDLNSQNGTFLNEQRLESDKMYALQPGDTVKLADISYVFDEI